MKTIMELAQFVGVIVLFLTVSAAVFIVPYYIVLWTMGVGR